MPATTLVIVSVAITSPLLPSTLWNTVAEEIIASALFMENWLLQYRAADYLAREIAPGVLQHFWSLGVEAQFYVIWPGIMILAIATGSRFRRSPHFSSSLAIFICVVTFIVVSIIMSQQNPARAYFSTTARIWEFGFGAIVASGNLRSRVSPRVAFLASHFGLLCIIGSAFLIREDMTFPGWIAVVPCLGSALLMVSGDAMRGSKLHQFLTWRPMTALGDISYSVYLWHWPLIIYSGYLLTSEPTFYVKLSIVLASILLAAISKVAIEDPFRQRGPLNWTQKAAIASLAFTLFSIGGATIPLFAKDRYVGSLTLQPRETAGSLHPGALALTHDAIVETNAPPYIPDITMVRSDKPLSLKSGCHASFETREALSCELGSETAFLHVVLVGDSHAGQLSDALSVVAKQLGWRYTHFSKTECPFIQEPITNYKVKGTYQECGSWNKNVMNKILELSPDFVITTQTRRYSVPGAKNRQESFDRLVQGNVSRWEQLQNHGIGVLPIRDIPFYNSNAADCVASGKTDCAQLRSEAVQVQQPITTAAEKFGVPFVDLTDAICGPEVCDTVVGNVFVWRDSNHLTATYVRSLAEELKRQLLLNMIAIKKT